METTYNYATFYGNAPNPPTGVYVRGDWTGLAENFYGDGSSINMVWARNNTLVIRFTFDSVNWGDDIVIWAAPQAEPIYLSAQGFQVQNFVNGSISVYQVMGQW